jgi:beta-glucosidase
MVTFHHFTSPRWLAASGGWEAQETPEKFARVCERAVANLGDLIPFACTPNEVNIGPLIEALMGTALSATRTESWFEVAARAVSGNGSSISGRSHAKSGSQGASF